MNIENFLNTDHVQRNRWWHWLLGTFVIITASTVVGVTFIISASVLGDHIASDISHRISLYLFPLSLFLCLWLVVRFWYKEPFLKLFTSAKQFRWKYFRRAAIIVLLSTVIYAALYSFYDPSILHRMQDNFTQPLYWSLLIAVLILVPFQATSEELFFRGYLNRAVNRYIKSPWIIFIITSGTFAALHLGNLNIGNQTFPYLTQMFAFGFFMCVLLFFEGGLESAISYHILNNIMTVFIIGHPSPEQLQNGLIIDHSPFAIWLLTISKIITMGLTCAVIIWANRKWGSIVHG